MSVEPLQCPICGAKISPEEPQCQYCGIYYTIKGDKPLMSKLDMKKVEMRQRKFRRLLPEPLRNILEPKERLIFILQINEKRPKKIFLITSEGLILFDARFEEKEWFIDFEDFGGISTEADSSWTNAFYLSIGVGALYKLKIHDLSEGSWKKLEKLSLTMVKDLEARITNAFNLWLMRSD